MDRGAAEAPQDECSQQAAGSAGAVDDDGLCGVGQGASLEPELAQGHVHGPRQVGDAVLEAGADVEEQGTARQDLAQASQLTGAAQAHHQLEDDDADDDGAEGEREFQGSSAV